MKKHIPNTITLMNLLCGSISIVMAFDGQMLAAGLLIFIAAVFDFFDGLAARLLHVKSTIGKELDSLADVISFGLAPSMIAFQLYRVNIAAYSCPEIAGYAVFLMAMLSAVRLAKFNLDERQTAHFIGMPTPINGMFWASIPLVQHFYKNFELPPMIILILSVLMALLLVSNIPMFSLKFTNLKLANKENRLRFSYLGFCVLIYVLFGIFALPVMFLFYPLLSIVLFVFKRNGK